MFPIQERELCEDGASCSRRNPHHLTTKQHRHLEALLPFFLRDGDDFKLSSAQLGSYSTLLDPEITLSQLQILRDSSNSQNRETGIVERNHVKSTTIVSSALSNVPNPPLVTDKRVRHLIGPPAEECHSRNYQAFCSKRLTKLATMQASVPQKKDTSSADMQTIQRNHIRPEGGDNKPQFGNKRKVLRNTQPLSKGWYRGAIVAVCQHTFFVKPRNGLPNEYNSGRDVYVPKQNFSKYLPSLQVGDEIDFLLGERDKAKPMARTARVSLFWTRSREVILEYFRVTLKKLLSDNKFNVLSEILPCHALWILFSTMTSPSGDAQFRYFLKLLHFLIAIMKASCCHKQLASEMLQLIVRTCDFGSNGKLCMGITENTDMTKRVDGSDLTVFEILSVFVQTAISMCPVTAKYLLPIVNQIGKNCVSATVQSWLLGMFGKVVVQDKSVSGVEDAWEDVPLIPSNEELQGSMLETDSHLSPVRIGEPYEDTEDYMDTHFRLLRTECFSAIQKGIHNLLSDTLDYRDMAVFHSVSLGYELSDTGFCFALQFTPAMPVRKWELSRHLMFGNLICISPSGKFNDIIWATVFNRDADLLNQAHIIVVQLCSEFNTSTTCDIMTTLWANEGSVVMVESPAYFHSFRPVLQSLQSFDMENFVLKDEIVFGKSVATFPNYLSLETTITPGFSLRQATEFVTLVDLVSNIQSSTTKLDSSQKTALVHALTNNLAIIQGHLVVERRISGYKLFNFFCLQTRE